MTVFDDIYRRNAWHGAESRSGPGSGSAATGPVAAAILELVDELEITTVLDVGCGDGYWLPDLPGYVGIDVSAEAIALASARHPGRRYEVGDVRDAPAQSGPTWGLILWRDALQHLSLEDGLASLAGILRTEPRFLLASTFVGGENVDIATGDAYSPDLTAEPFSLPAPDRLIFDGYGYASAGEIRDPRKHLGLWAL